MDPRDLISVRQAFDIIDAATVTPRKESVALSNAVSRMLAQDIMLDRDAPAFNRSLLDGFAVRVADVAQAPVELDVVGQINAGGESDRPVDKNQAVAIMTGAPLPAGADAVVPVEHTELIGNRVRVLKPLSGTGVGLRGSDARAHTVIIPAHTRITPAQIAAAASAGAAVVDVFARPRVAVLTTGDELVSIDATPVGAQIRNANNPMLIALLTTLGCDVTDLGAVLDDRDAIRTALRHGISFDMLFITGGMSMGRLDFVPELLKELQFDFRISKLRIKPGKPFVFATRGAGIVFGLPGNPVSAFVCTRVLAARLIARAIGRDPNHGRRQATLSAPVEANGAREFYQPAILCGDSVEPLRWIGSADVFTLARANALIQRPENAQALPAGASVPLLEIDA